MKFEDQCGGYIKHINDVLQRLCNNALQAKGLTMSQLTVLHQLENAPAGELSLKELEKSLRVAQSTAAGIVFRLEQKGFVESFGSLEDRRIKMVRITPSGRSCFAESEDHAVTSEALLLAALSQEERDAFRVLLKKVSESL